MASLSALSTMIVTWIITFPLLPTTGCQHQSPNVLSEASLHISSQRLLQVGSERMTKCSFLRTLIWRAFTLSFLYQHPPLPSTSHFRSVILVMHNLFPKRRNKDWPSMKTATVLYWKFTQTVLIISYHLAFKVEWPTILLLSPIGPLKNCSFLIQ